MTQGKLNRATQREVVKLVRGGMSYRAAAERFGVSHETIRQTVKKHDPKLVESRGKRKDKPEPEPRYCANHPDRELTPDRRKYCTDDCAQASIVLHNLTIYREKKLQAVSRCEGREGRLRPDTLQRQILHKGTKTYNMLKKQGLLERLPDFVEVR